MIKKVRIINFKQFKDIEVSFEKNNILVGNNNSGKSTILEAITLALTGYYHGKNIKNCLSQSLFNKDVVDEFLKGFNPGEIAKDLPKIIIEIHLEETNDTCMFLGNKNENGEASCGFSFIIEFDSNYKDLYEEMVRTDEVKSLPTEYYLFRWFSFDRNNKIITKNLPIKPYLVDSDNFQSGSFYTSRIIKGFFTEEDSTQIIQDERKVYNSLLSCQSIENVNQKIRNDTYLKEHNVSIGLNDLTKGSWEGLLNTQIDNLPMDNAGKGEQCVVKTRLSFSSSNIPAKAEKVILIEEPECHLSHSTLNTLLSLIGKESKTYQVITTTHSSFVANKLGLNNLILLHDSKSLKLNELDKETNSFFEKISGFDTLRLVLSKKAVLVEGASDELIFQRAYMDFHGGRIPLYDGIDVISVGLAFKRFLSISQSLSLKTIVITDNDGDLTAIHKKYDEYENCHNIFISYSKHINMPRDFSNPQGLSIKNLNTLEPEIVSANKGNLPLLFSVLNLKPVDESSLIKYMVANKTEMALRIFTSNKNISYPQYIIDAVKKCDDK